MALQTDVKIHALARQILSQSQAQPRVALNLGIHLVPSPGHQTGLVERHRYFLPLTLRNQGGFSKQPSLAHNTSYRLAPFSIHSRDRHTPQTYQVKPVAGRTGAVNDLLPRVFFYSFLGQVGQRIFTFRLRAPLGARSISP